MISAAAFQTVEECIAHSDVWNKFYATAHNNVRKLTFLFAIWISVAEHDIWFIYFPDEDDRNGSRNFCFLAVQPRDMAGIPRKFYWIQ